MVAVSQDLSLSLSLPNRIEALFSSNQDIEGTIRAVLLVSHDPKQDLPSLCRNLSEVAEREEMPMLIPNIREQIARTLLDLSAPMEAFYCFKEQHTMQCPEVATYLFRDIALKLLDGAAQKNDRQYLDASAEAIKLVQDRAREYVLGFQNLGLFTEETRALSGIERNAVAAFNVLLERERYSVKSLCEAAKERLYHPFEVIKDSVGTADRSDIDDFRKKINTVLDTCEYLIDQNRPHVEGQKIKLIKGLCAEISSDALKARNNIGEDVVRKLETVRKLAKQLSSKIF